MALLCIWSISVTATPYLLHASIVTPDTKVGGSNNAQNETRSGNADGRAPISGLASLTFAPSATRLLDDTEYGP